MRINRHLQQLVHKKKPEQEEELQMEIQANTLLLPQFTPT
jgi:hypothetical protein